MLQPLSQETRKLDDMTIRLPLKRLQRKQRHVLMHAVWLLRYLDSHLGDNEGEFFLFLHDVAMNSDAQILDLWTSMNDRKNVVEAVYRSNLLPVLKRVQINANI